MIFTNSLKLFLNLNNLLSLLSNMALDALNAELEADEALPDENDIEKMLAAAQDTSDEPATAVLLNDMSLDALLGTSNDGEADEIGDLLDKDERNEILTVLKEYDSMYNTEWDRSIESMRVEWTVHNMLYDLHYESARTKHVDLDNSEEELYSNPILQRLLK